MVLPTHKTSSAAHSKKRNSPRDTEEESLQRLNRLFAKAAPLAARANSAALTRFRREIITDIRRAAY